MPLNYVTLVLDLYDGQGSAVIKGTAALTPSVQLADPQDHMVITQTPVPAVFHASGFPQVKLLATDNGAPSPPGWEWVIAFSGVAGDPPGGSFPLPFANGATQYWSALTPPSGVTPVTITSLDGGSAATGGQPVASFDGGSA